jgi:S-adenosylhomocysteine hydrolase
LNGRKEMLLAETRDARADGLREEYGASKPLAGARITGSCT